MGLLDNLRDRLRGGDYYDDYAQDGYDEYDDYAEPEHHTSGLLGNTSRPEAESVSVYTRSGRPVAQGSRSPSAGGFSTSERYEQEYAPEPAPIAGAYTPSVAPVPAAAYTPARQTSGQLPPYIMRPTTYDDVEMVVRRVRTNQPVVLSFKGTSIDVAKRILDFCFGLACGLDGAVEEVGDRAFVVLPHGLFLSEADLEKLARDGVIAR
jgi:cell division inhibitor SepF